jgi:hypothetical protein
MPKKLVFSLIALSFVGQTSLAGHRLTCAGDSTLYVESSPLSGLPIPHIEGAIFFEDKLVERASNITAQTKEIQWEKASLQRSEVNTLATSSNKDHYIKVTQEVLSLRSTGINVSEKVICSEVRFFAPVP